MKSLILIISMIILYAALDKGITVIHAHPLVKDSPSKPVEVFIDPLYTRGCQDRKVSCFLV